MRFHRLYKAATLLFPERCPYCREMIDAEELACKDCFDILRQKHRFIKSGARGYRCVSSFVYAGKARRVILLIKFRKRTQYISQLAAILADDIRAVYGENTFDIITAVPMHPVDLREREYNQSVILAKKLGEVLSIPYLDTLEKVKKTKKQHKLKYAERKTNLSGAFKPVNPEELRGKRILLTDDIITSGYTLSTCARALNRAKPTLICCATIASAQDRFPAESVI